MPIRRLPGGATTSLRGLAGELVFKSANYRRLDRRGRGSNKLTHLLELGHDGLALDAELLREFVNPDLRHCAPLLGPEEPGLPAGRGRACSVRRQVVLFIAACSSGAHRNPAFFPRTSSPARYSATLPAGRAAGRRRARANALRRWARSKHARLGCKYAPRPGSRVVTSGTISVPAATSRIKSVLAARFPQPIQVRIGAAGLLSSLQGLRVGSTSRRAGRSSRRSRSSFTGCGRRKSPCAASRRAASSPAASSPAASAAGPDRSAGAPSRTAASGRASAGCRAAAGPRASAGR
jgi:hypothetical protein